jgi:uncharacterized protein (DUF1499 family)
MTDYPEQHRSRAAGWCRRTAAFSAVLLLVAWIGHHFGLLETLGYFWVLAVVALLAAVSLLMAAFAFSRIWAFGNGGGRDLVVGVLVTLIVLTPYGVVAWLMLSYPPLRDISTDIDAPPALPTASQRTADMNALMPLTPGEQRLQAESYPQITGRRYSAAFDETIAAVEAVLARQGWRVMDPPADAAGASDEVSIGAVANPLVLDLPADVSVRIAVDGDTTLVDMRSASRYGRHDLGDNARRITAFLAELDLQIASQTSPAPTTE